ncbi:MAG TPA: DedA family protein [Gammaproteobacteria bacterium]|nr:DedA family protein [Gammaproteobacteria bacterium]
MLEHVIAAVAGFIIATIAGMGYRGIVLLMAIESACIPLPSEVVLPFSGYLVAIGRFNLWAVALAGATGCVLGSLIAYYVGLRGGRPLAERFGKYLLISQRDLDRADHWFEHYGEITIFISRLLPVVRTFISFPAGVARMRVVRFVVLTFAGSFLWCLALAWIGMKLGEHWDTLGVYFHRFDALIVALAIVGAVWYVRRHLKSRNDVDHKNGRGERI